LILLGAQALSGPNVVSEPITTARTTRSAPDGLTSVRVDVPWYSQFDDHGTVKGGNTSASTTARAKRTATRVRRCCCNPMVKEMMRNAKTPATPGGKGASDNINIANTKDTRGRIEPNVANAQEGLGYINSELESGRPVMVGVTWKTPLRARHDGCAPAADVHFVDLVGLFPPVVPDHWAWGSATLLATALCFTLRPSNGPPADVECGRLAVHMGRRFRVSAAKQATGLSVNQLLSEVFDRGLTKGEEKLSPEDLELFLIWDFVIEYEMGGLTGFLYNRVNRPGRIDATARALRKYEVEPLAKVAEELSRRFRFWKNNDDASSETWDEARTRHISDARLERLEDQLTRAGEKGYGVRESKLKRLVSARKVATKSLGKGSPRKAAQKARGAKKA